MPTAPLRICHVIHSLGPGGAEHLLVDLARVAPQFGLRLAVLSLMPTDGLHYPARLRQMGVEVASLRLPGRWDPRALGRSVPAIAAFSRDIVHTHLKHADLVGAWAAHRLRVPLVSTLHLIEDAPTPVGRFKLRLAAAGRDRVARRTITVSDALRRWYLGTLPVDPSRVVTVRNGVAAPERRPPAVLAELRAALGVRADGLMATMVGIMRPGKGHAELLAAAGRVPRSAGVSYVLAGDGPLRSRLEAAARGSSVADRVIFAGFRDDVADLLAASDLIVHPSRLDALPTALIEGLAAGLPAVASAIGG